MSWLFEFVEHWWSKDSSGNVERSIKSVLFLASGRGVFYQRWKHDCFYKGTPITDATDFSVLHKQAVDYKNQMIAKYEIVNKGKDYKDGSKGWLLDHPTKKLAVFQEHMNKTAGT